MLGPYDVGQRVVVRRRAGQRGHRHVFSDVLGVLVDLTETEITIRTLDGVVRVPVVEITHAKRVPATRRLTATERLERVAAAGWPAAECGYLGEWLLRASAGWTARGNSALPVGDPGRTLVDAVDAVESWYRDRDLPPRIAVAEPVGGRLVAELTRRGWSPSPPTLVQTAPLGPGGTDERVRLDASPPPAWFTAVGGYKGGLPDAARAVLTGVPRARFAGVYGPDGAARAVGRGVIAGDGRWLGVSLVTVDAAERRRGLGRAVVEALTCWAYADGAQQVYLQVEEHNAAAVAMYAALGFTTHHRYLTWTAP